MVGVSHKCYSFMPPWASHAPVSIFGSQPFYQSQRKRFLSLCLKITVFITRGSAPTVILPLHWKFSLYLQRSRVSLCSKKDKQMFHFYSVPSSRCCPITLFFFSFSTFPFLYINTPMSCLPFGSNYNCKMKMCHIHIKPSIQNTSINIIPFNLTITVKLNRTRTISIL